VDQKPTAVTQFVESYALHSANRDFNALVAQFAETFLVAGPAGAHCVGAADFLRVLPKRVELFASLGCQSSELIDMQNSWLDSRYAHVRTTWRFTSNAPIRPKPSTLNPFSLSTQDPIRTASSSTSRHGTSWTLSSSAASRRNGERRQERRGSAPRRCYWLGTTVDRLLYCGVSFRLAAG
jgi:hypothetical protein